MHPLLLLSCLATFAAPTPNLPQGPGVVFADGATPTSLTVRVLDETTPSTPAQVLLQDVEFLPIEFTNRLPNETTRRDRPRREHRNGLTRIELRNGAKVLHYRRGGGAFYGFLLITQGGRARVLHEAAGVGSGGVSQPFTDRIGVANDGRHAALVTLAGAIHVCRLDGATFASTGTPSRPLTLPPGTAIVEPLSPTVGANSVFFGTADDRYWRCALADGASPVEITPPVQPGARAKDVLAISGDGLRAVFLYGPRDQWRIYLVDDTRAPVALPPAPSKYEEPTYLPEEPLRVAMALNEDGSRLLYVDGVLRDELFELDVAGVLPPVHLTGDHNFQPYIGSGVLPTFFQSKTTMAIGDPDRMDWVASTPGTPLVQNLTQTNGNVAPPFASGAIAVRAVHALSGDRFLSTEVALGGGFQVREVATAPAAHAIVATGLSAVPEAGFAPGATPPLRLSSANGDRLVDGATGAVLLQAPAGIALSRSVGRLGFQAFRASAGGVSAPVLFVPPTTLVVLSADAGLRSIALTDGDGLVVDTSTLLHVGPLGVVTLSRAPVRVVLSGLDS